MTGKMSIRACRWLLILAAAWMAVSCSSGSLDDGGSADGRSILVFKTCSGDEIVPMEQEAAVGVFFWSDGTGDILRKNEMVIIGENGEPVQQRDTLVPAALDEYRFFAYSPYDSSWDDILDSVLEFAVEKDQTSEVNYRNSDLMMSHKIERKGFCNEAVFDHVMAKIVLHVTDKTGTFDLTGASVTMHGLVCGAYVYVADGSCLVMDMDSASVSCHMLDSRDRRASLAAVIPPQETEEPILAFDLALAGSVYGFTLSDVPPFEAGKVYVYSLRMTDRGLELEDSTITNWEDDGGGSFNVAFE